MAARKLGALLGVLALLLAACSSAAPTATTAPTVAAPRATAAPTPTTAPVATAVGKATPVAQATPVATPTQAPSGKPAAATPKQGGVLRTFVPWDVLVWDLQKEPGQAYPMQYSQTAVFSRLVQWEHAMADTCGNPLVLNAAESFNYVDDKTMEVKLRPDIRFHDKAPVNGRAVTAEDVAFSFNRAKQVAISGSITPALKYLDKVEATGPLTVRFLFNSPYSMAPMTLLASNMVSFILAPEAGGAGPEKDYSNPDKNWIGTGPFLFKEWRPGVKIVFSRNPNYFRKPQPYLEGLEVITIPDAGTQFAAFTAGKLDMLLRAAGPIVENIRSTRRDVQINGCPYYAGFGTFWMRNDKPPFDDIRVRRALNMAVDRKAMIDSLFSGDGEVLVAVSTIWDAFSVKPSELPSDLQKYLEYRPDEAKKLLAEAGYPNGFKATLETTRQFGSPFNESQEAFIAMMAKVGVTVEGKWYERGQFSSGPLQGKYDDIGWTRSAEVGQPDLLGSLHSKSPIGANRSRVNDPEMDKLVDQYSAAFKTEDRIKLARQIQVRAVDQAYFIQLPTPLEYAVLQPYVRDFGRMSHMSRSASFYDRVWFDK
ncbi:MAG: ABC transporter substrate-binding protein [Chloroflexi bacterium]|nr:ABC transporter substrate-binding protein [Chloroflexota bacterium]